MPIRLFDRIKQKTITSGSGTLTLGDSVDAFLGFSDVFNNGDQTFYVIETLTSFEVGIGTYNAGTLSRDTVLKSTNNDQLLNLPGDLNTYAFVTYPASGSVYTNGDRVITNVSAVNLTGTVLNTTSNLYNLSGHLYFDGSPYVRLPSSGSQYQILEKVDNTSNEVQWIDNYAKEIVQYVKNSTHTTLNKGQVVYINGADGSNPTIQLAIGNAESTSSKVIGFLKQNLAQGEFGYVVTEGNLDGLNTNAAISEGDPIWLSPSVSGGVLYGVANKPHAPNHLVFLGYVIRKQINNGKIYVKVQNGFELEELHNVAALNPSNGDTIVYSSDSGLWLKQPSSSLYSAGSGLVLVGTEFRTSGTGNFTGGVKFPDGAIQTIAYTGQTSSWNINITGLTDNISNGQTVIFTGIGGTNITYDNNTNTVSISGGGSSSSSVRGYINVTGNTTLSINSDVIFIDSTSSSINIGLPLAVGNGGKQISFKWIAGTNSVQLSGSNFETIDGSNIWCIDYIYDSFTVISNNQNWYIF